jgi:hypothetical protein
MANKINAPQMTKIPVNALDLPAGWEVSGVEVAMGGVDWITVEKFLKPFESR